MKLFNRLALLSAVYAASLLHAQSRADQSPTLTTHWTLIVVPALVRDKRGQLAYTLTARDFVLTDDGVPQRLTLEEDNDSAPLDLVIDLEVGGAGTREFDRLGSLTPMLDALVGAVPHRIAVVGFDSQPALVHDFTADTGAAAEAILMLMPGCSRQQHQENCEAPHSVHDANLGNNGAAIRDSLTFSVDLLRKQPAGSRRAILLISETLDRSSRTLEGAVRAISETNTAISSIAFSTAGSEAAHYAHRQLPTQPAEPGGSWLKLANHAPNPVDGCMGTQTDDDPDKPPAS